MTFAPPTASGPATRRIGFANGLLWIAAALVLVVVGATAAYAFVVNPYTGGGGGLLGGGGAGYPWQVPEPLEADEVETDVWGADASGVVRIPEADAREPLRVSLESGGDIGLHVTAPGDLDAPADDRPWPQYVGYVYGDRSEILVPTGDDLELWVEAEGAWRLRIEPVDDLITVTDDVSGEGDAVLVYRGESLSGTFRHRGEGVFFVDVLTLAERDTGAIIESGAVDERLSWDAGSFVVFVIESDAGRGGWTVSIDQLRGPGAETPDPTPTPTESDG